MEDPVANDNNQQAAPGRANQQLPAIDGHQPPAVHKDPYRTFVVNPTLSECKRGLVQDKLTYSPRTTRYATEVYAYSSTSSSS